MLTLVAEDCAVDALLSAVIDKASPDEAGISSLCAEYELVAGTDEQLSLPAVGVLISRVVPCVKVEAVKVAVLCYPPQISIPIPDQRESTQRSVMIPPGASRLLPDLFGDIAKY